MPKLYRLSGREVIYFLEMLTPWIDLESAS